MIEVSLTKLFNTEMYLYLRNPSRERTKRNRLISTSELTIPLQNINLEWKEEAVKSQLLEIRKFSVIDSLPRATKRFLQFTLH